jgi:GNAT superfamily N-acetyltransferase
MTTLMILEAEPKDGAVLAAVIRTASRAVAERFALTRENCPSHPSFCTDEWIKADMERGVRYFAGLIRGKMCGCVALKKVDAETAYLERLSVLPGHRRKGVGRALVERVLGEALGGGARIIRLAVIADLAPLVKWYTAQGFLEVKTEKFPNLPFQVTILQRSLRELDPAQTGA